MIQIPVINSVISDCINAVNKTLKTMKMGIAVIFLIFKGKEFNNSKE